MRWVTLACRRSRPTAKTAASCSRAATLRMRIPPYRPITSHSDEYLIKGIQESAKHSWYKDEAPQAPWKGTTIPAYDGWSDDGKYSC
ncbi:nickel-dependent hydrogenase large subunit [Escherichia coli]